MKQITLDYETYLNEIKAAQLRGYALTSKTIESLKTYIKTLDGFANQRERDRAKWEVIKILQQLENVE